MTTPSHSPSANPEAPREVEVAIVGGGPAGLSAALVLGRARRNVVVIDAGDAAHFVSDAVHGFLGMENVPPRELRRRVWEQLEPFDVSLVEAKVVGGALGAPDGIVVAEGRNGARSTGTAFTLTLDDGSEIVAQAVLLAGGIRYGVQPVDGLADLWGSKLFHCPFCHGWEVVGKRVAAIGAPDYLAHMPSLMSLWVDGGPTGFAIGGGDGAAEAPAVPVVRRVRADGGEVVIETTDGAEARFDAVFAAPVLSATDDLPEQLGAVRDVESPMAGGPLHVAVDPMGATAVRGLFAAGDLQNPMPSVAPAVQSGFNAGVGIVRLLAGG